MPRIKLTAAAVERLRSPKTGQVDYFDAGYPALCLRITEHGVKSWTYFGRVHGKLKRATLGRYPDLSLAAPLYACLILPSRGRSCGTSRPTR